MPDRPTRASTQVVWLNDGWKRWMTWREPAQPPVPEAALEPHSIPGAICADLAVDLAQVPEAAVLALADLLVTTDELNTERDERGGRASELNTGVVYFRAGKGARTPSCVLEPPTGRSSAAASAGAVRRRGRVSGQARWCRCGARACSASPAAGPRRRSLR